MNDPGTMISYGVRAARRASRTVTIIGAGNMGHDIGHRLGAEGHSVTIVDRDPEEAGQLAGLNFRSAWKLIS